LVEEQVFLMVPQEALGWARQANLPLLPQDYDIIAPTQGLASEDARINTPDMFSSVRGRVTVLGTARGQNFEFYRLQFGQGLNPQSWLQIGDDRRDPVWDGQLAVWDTSGLNGLYVLQLLVVSEDQQVESAIVQVTVDNQKPAVKIVYPAEGQLLAPQDIAVLQAEASDDLELSEVQFFMNDRLILALKTAPFAVPWNPKPGAHRLEVRAIDRSGNTSEAGVRFVVGAAAP
jgi:hypothetical protein